MRKNNSLYANEIRLADILKTIIDKKIIIVLIMFISILIGIGNYYQEKDRFKILLNIKPSKGTEFTNFLPIYNVTYDDFLNPLKKLKQNSTGEKTESLTARNEISLIMLEKFIEELLDYEEFISVLSINKDIEKKTKDLSIGQERQSLYEYTQLIDISKPDKKEI